MPLLAMKKSPMIEQEYAVRYIAVDQEIGPPFTPNFERFLFQQQAHYGRLMSSWQLLDSLNVKFILDELLVANNEEQGVDKGTWEQIVSLGLPVAPWRLYNFHPEASGTFIAKGKEFTSIHLTTEMCESIRVDDTVEFISIEDGTRLGMANILSVQSSRVRDIPYRDMKRSLQLMSKTLDARKAVTAVASGSLLVQMCWALSAYYECPVRQDTRVVTITLKATSAINPKRHPMQLVQKVHHVLQAWWLRTHGYSMLVEREEK